MWSRGIMDEPLASLAQTVPTIFSHSNWEQATDTQIPDQEWHRSLGVLLKHAVTAHRGALDLHAAELRPHALGVEETNDACHQLLLVAERVSDWYGSTVGSYHRSRVEDHHTPSRIDELH
ncbi:hypothetical protein DMJ13_18615 [halophilic archaeon]|nr:hypothetical protein DMJ13_18615 [halophilic archaeon]